MKSARLHVIVKKLLLADFLYYGLLSLAFLFVSLYPLYKKISITPPGYIYTMAQYKIRDFFIYTAIMRQGHTKWLLEDTTIITDKVSPGSFVNWFYIILGKAGYVLHISDQWMYYIGMYGSSILLILGVIYLAKILLPRSLQRPVFLLVFAGGTFPYFINGFQIADLWIWTLQWESAFHRFTHVPAHMFTEALEVFVMAWLILFVRKGSFRYLLYALSTQFLITLLYPPLSMPLMLAVFIATLVYYGTFFRLKKIIAEYKMIASITGFLILTFIGLLIMQVVVRSAEGYNLQAVTTIPANHLSIAMEMAGQYLRMFWLFLPFMAFSLLTVFRKWKWERLFIFIFWCVPFILIFVAPYIGYESWRAANSMPFVTASILAIWGIEELAKMLQSFHIKHMVRVKQFFRWGIVILLIAIAFPQNRFYFEREAKPMFTTEVYIPENGMEALSYLATAAPERTVVLSLEYVGDLIPMYSGLRGYGTKDYNLRWYQRGGALDPEIEAFYKGTMSNEQAKQFLARTHIKYVWFGWDERRLTLAIKYTDILQPVFTKGNVTIYKVI